MNSKPFQMTARCPENRRGTRTYRSYAYSLGCNGVPGGMTALLATPRQQNRAWRLCQAGVTTSRVQGRVIRAVMRSIYADLGADCDALYYGHA